MTGKRTIMIGGLAGLLLGAVFGIGWSMRPYTSIAVLRTVPSMIRERFIGQPDPGSDRLMSSVAQTVLSRGNLTNIINHHNLYGVERDRMPMIDVVDRMRDGIRISHGNGDLVTIAFSYQDRDVAQRVNADLVSRIMTKYVRNRPCRLP